MDARYTDGSVVSGGANVSLAGKRAEGVPAAIARAGLSLAGARGSATLLVSHTAAAFADALNTRVPTATGAIGLVPAYTILDLNASWRLSDKLRLRAGVSNLLDRAYFTKRPAFYPGPGVWPSDGRGVQVSLVRE
jgi:Fe(3+) dicitrate transport protein